MIIEMPPLYGIGSKVGIEETSTFAACAADARIDYSCCSDGTKLRTRRTEHNVSTHCLSGAGRTTHDVSWSMLCNCLGCKCDHAGVAFAVVNKPYSTQACSGCGALSGPQGREGLAVRQWVCRGCGLDHDRDQNAALNMAGGITACQP
jgi:hypothetical protein